jgi:hypothetical protein
VLRRHVVPPLDLRAYASPLTSFRAMVRDQGDVPLFTVEGWDGEAWLRLAVMDSYDGTVYNVSGNSRVATYDRVGPAFGNAVLGGGTAASAAAGTAGGAASGTVAGTAASAAAGTAGGAASSEVSEVIVTVGDYEGVWVPTIDEVVGAVFAGPRADKLADELYHNSAAGALVDAAGLRQGDSFRLAIEPAQAWSDQQLAGRAFATVLLGDLTQVPDALTDTATKLAGEASEPIELVRNITAAVRTDGFFSHGLADQAASLPGHSVARLDSLLSAPQWVGDDEQYATLTALVCRQLGIPARVVMGFRADEASQVSGSTWIVTGNDVHAWIEVAFDGAGWVRFDPVPPEDQVPIEQVPESRSEPQPQVLRQPPPPVAPQDVPPEALEEDEGADEEDQAEGFDWALVGWIATWVVAPLVIVAGPPLVVIWAKGRRRRRRRRAPDPANRLAGGWQEIVDQCVDLGLPVAPATTRQERGDQLGRELEDPGLAALARVADRSVFGPGEPTEEQIAAYWTDVATAKRFAASRVSVWRRWRAAVSVGSFKAAHPRTDRAGAARLARAAKQRRERLRVGAGADGAAGGGVGGIGGGVGEKAAR